MNGAHLHLMLIHFPIAGTILAIPLLLAAWRMKNETMKLVGLSLIVVVGLLGWAAFWEGGKAARVIWDLPDIPKGAIHEHAEAADYAVWTMGLNAVLAAVGLFAAWKNRKLPQWVFIAVALFTIFCSTVLVRTAYLGGQIRHPESKLGFTAPAEVPGK